MVQCFSVRHSPGSLFFGEILKLPVHGWSKKFSMFIFPSHVYPSITGFDSKMITTGRQLLIQFKYVQPQRKDKKGQVKAGRFDTGLIYSGDKDKMGIHGALSYIEALPY